MVSQKEICSRFNACFEPVDTDSKVGIALETLHLLPLNALRHAPERDTCGWYIWGGTVLEDREDFFQPLHAMHLTEKCPALIPYLALPPGWRVLLAPGYEDVWYDSSLL